MPVAIGLSTALWVWWVGGSLRAPACIHDEAAYLLQAKIFAAFRLSMPSPPLPEFFEQYHVLLVPRLTPKYFPGHALLLVPGIWMGLPGLMPVALHALTGGLLFAAGQRLAGKGVALLAWALWLSAPLLSQWRVTYLSQSSSTAAWMASIWLLLLWWASGRSRQLVALALCVAWLAITRPLTAVALAIPVGLAVLAGSWRRRAFRPLLAAVAVGVGVIALLPLWSAACSGDWKTLPFTRYSEVYFPWDRLGFGDAQAAPERELPPDMERFAADFRVVHAAHTPASLPGAFARRLVSAGREMWGGSAWRSTLLFFFGLGLLCLEKRGWWATSAVVASFLVYLLYAHPPRWAVYYHEIHPILAFVTALGLSRALGAIVARSWRAPAPNARRLAIAVAAVTVLVLGIGLADTAGMKALLERRRAYASNFVSVLASIGGSKALVFVRYDADHDPHFSLIENPPDHDRARIWVARDRGADNQRLIALAPDRELFLFDEGTSTLYPLKRER